MKILLSTDTVGGVWDFTVTLARQLDAMGCEVLIAAIGEPRDERLARIPPGVQVTSRAYRLEWMPGAADDVREAARWLRHLAQLWAADVVHLNQMAYAAFGFPAPVLTAVHSDVRSWWMAVRGLPAPPEWDTYARWVSDGLHASDAVVAPTRYQAGLARLHYGVDHVRVIHNGVEIPAHEPSPRTDPLVLCVGRAWDEAKGVDVLDRAVARMGPGAPPVHLLGETVAPHGAAFLAQHLRLHGRVERAAVDAWMRRASIYVSPSRYEPFGLAPLEAAVHGCALVLSDIESFREVWDGCADFFPAGDAEALASVLARLVADPARVERLAAGARKRALRRYTARRMAEEYVALYRRLAGEPARPEHARSVA
jgi:glycosyltransferase involved in cell wall biosynthesis